MREIIHKANRRPNTLPFSAKADPGWPSMYVRFVTENLDESSGRRQGLFRAANVLRRSGLATAKDLQALDDLSNWFSENLLAPDRFSVSLKPHRKAQAISWFRDSATAYIERMRVYQRILEPYGTQVAMLRTSRPGYIVYEDEHQVVAYPFADTPN